MVFHSHILAMRLGPLEFGQPAWLLALLLLLPVLYWWKTSRVGASPLRRWVSLLLRVGLMAAIIFSLADTRMVWTNHGICVAFVVDQSQSVSTDARTHVRDLIRDQIDKMTRDDRFAIVEFGGDSVLGALPSPRGTVPPAAKVEDTGHTNIARAIRLAMASFPADKQKRVVLFTDGNQNEEDALREARIAGVKDVDIDVVPIIAQHGHEVMVDQVIVPPHVRKDARFMVRALITSDTDQDVELHILRDGASLRPDDPGFKIDQTLKAGHNVVDIPDILSDGGAHQYQVTIVPKNSDADTFAANNTGYALTQVDAPGKVLLVPGRSNDPTYLSDALLNSGIQVEVHALPATVDDLAAYDCVIMDNVPYADVANSPQLPALKKWVKDFGGGLVLVGGDDSFGPGGYTGTILEELAPVQMDIKRQKHLASLAVVVVMDKSGSMGAEVGPGVEKMQLADEGACEVVKLLDDKDLAMVGATDTSTYWVDNNTTLLPMTPGNKRRLSDGARSFRAGGGGIFCYTALENSYELIDSPRVQAMTRHVIMFADAADSDQQTTLSGESSIDLAKQQYQKYGVTTTVIGMGTMMDKDVQYQQEVARAGHGLFLITADVNQLPRLFLKDAFIVSRQAFIEDKNGISLTPYASPLLRGFVHDNKVELPRIYGYVGTTLKHDATLALHGKQADDPVLAHWTTGLGKCVAFTSDSTSRWGRDWVGWDGYAKFWSQVVRWASRSTTNNGVTTTTVIEGNQGRVIVDAVDADGKPINSQQLQANVISPDQTSEAQSVQLEQIAPGRYQGKFTVNKRGSYLVAVSQGAGDAKQVVSVGGTSLSYPQEYKDLEANVPLLKNLADASGGLYLTDVKNLFDQKPELVHTFWPLWQVLLVLVTSVLFLDIAWRRLNAADWLRPRSQGLAVATKTDASLGAFRTVKSGRHAVETQRTTLRDRVAAAADTTPVVPSTVSASQANDNQTGGAAASAPVAAPPPDAPGGYTNRLLTAKNRAKQQIKEQSEENAS